MGRVNSRTAKHNRLIAEAADSAILREIREKRKAAEREAKMNSVEFKIEMAQTVESLNLSISCAIVMYKLFV